MTQTLTELFAQHLEIRPDALLYRYLHDGDPAQAEVWSYAETYARAAAVARLLGDEGLTGQRVLLLHAPGLDYIAAFLGCLLAGRSPSRHTRLIRRGSPRRCRG